MNANAHLRWTMRLPFFDRDRYVSAYPHNPIPKTVFVAIVGLCSSGCGQREIARMTESPFFLVGCVGIVAANAIWMAERVPFRRVVAGNALLVLVTIVALSLSGCSSSSRTQSLARNEQSQQAKFVRLP